MNFTIPNPVFGMPNNVDMPRWLVDIMEQTFGVPRDNHKVASKQAIDSLEPVNDLEGDMCPICYEPYVGYTNKKTKVDPAADAPVAQLDLLVEALDARVPPARWGLQFRDPPLLMPVDVSARTPARFPQRNLCSGVRVGETEMFPNNDPAPPQEPDRHIPVRMPHCGHVFGRPCLVEWLHTNVSCPLCRKEVELTSGNARGTAIRDNCTFRFTSADEATPRIERLTNVFSPHRHAHAPGVTPLTDMLVPQAWATPSWPDHLAPPPACSADPLLVMARNYPVVAPRRAMVFGPNDLFGRPARREEGNA